MLSAEQQQQQHHHHHDDDDDDDDDDGSRPKQEQEQHPRRCSFFFFFMEWMMDGNTNALGFMLDTIAGGLILVGSGAFFVSVIIKLAKNEAGCDDNDNDNNNDNDVLCHERVHGMKPSSILTTYATTVNMASAILLPAFGAIVDTTNHRLLIGRIFAILFLVSFFPTTMVNANNWFIVSIMFAVVGFFADFKQMCLFAYLPELTSDETTLNRYTRTISVTAFSSIVIYLIVVVSVSTMLNNNKGSSSSSSNDIYNDKNNSTNNSSSNNNNDEEQLDDDIRTARIAQSISFGIATIFFFVAWGYLLEPRPPSRTRRPSKTICGWVSSLWQASFVHLYQTAIKVHHQHRVLQWFFVAVAIGEAATSAILLLAITYLTDVLNFSATQNGAAIVILLLSCIPGGYLSYWCSNRYNPVTSSIVAITILLINTALVAGIVQGPEQEGLAYVFAVPWGVGIGWKVTVDRMLYAMILPKGESNYAEFAGAYIFSRYCLTWLPPLVFTLINERTNVSIQWSMASLDIFFLLALCTYVFGVGVNSYAQAVADAKPEEEEQQQPESLANNIDDFPDKVSSIEEEEDDTCEKK